MCCNIVSGMFVRMHNTSYIQTIIYIFYLDMHINIISELRNMPVSYCFSKCMLYLHKGMDNGRIMEGIWRSVKAVRQMLGRSMNTVTLNGGPLEQLSTSIIEDSGKPVSLVGLDDT